MRPSFLSAIRLCLWIRAGAPVPTGGLCGRFTKTRTLRSIRAYGSANSQAPHAALRELPLRRTDTRVAEMLEAVQVEADYTRRFPSQLGAKRSALPSPALTPASHASSSATNRPRRSTYLFRRRCSIFCCACSWRKGLLSLHHARPHSGAASRRPSDRQEEWKVTGSRTVVRRLPHAAVRLHAPASVGSAGACAI